MIKDQNQFSGNRMSEIIKTSLDGIKSFADIDSAFGSAINTPNGVTVIPVSKITLGFASGGLDFNGKHSASDKSFGGGGGTALSITPMAFIAVNRDAEISMIPIGDNTDNSIEKLISLIEHSPEIIEKIKGALS